MKFKTSRAFAAVVFAAICATVLFASAPRAVGQEDITGHKLYFGVKPLPSADMKAFQQAPAAGLKMWSYKATSTRVGSKGKKFTGVMVGNSPITTNGTTETTVYVVPLIFKIGGQTFNPTTADSACLGGKVPLTVLKQSPMIVATHDFKVNGVDVGKAQYSDAFQRANFWTYVKAKGGTYHNALAYKFLPAITISPGTSHSVLFGVKGSPCRTTYGGIEINWFDSLVTGKIIPSLASKGVGPTNLPVFMI